MKKSDMQFMPKECSGAAQRDPRMASGGKRLSGRETGIKESWREQLRGAYGMGSLFL